MKKYFLITFLIVFALLLGLMIVKAEDGEVIDPNTYIIIDGSSMVPQIGGTPVVYGPDDLPEDAEYEIITSEWREYGGYEFETFENGKMYEYKLTMCPIEDSGFEFSKQFVYITDIQWDGYHFGGLKLKDGKYCMDFNAFITLNVPEGVKIPINNITLDGTILIPVVGETPKTLTELTDQRYTVLQQMWIEDDFQTPVEQFEPNKHYFYAMYICSNPGYTLETTSIDITGIELLEPTPYYDSEYDCITFLGGYETSESPFIPVVNPGETPVDPGEAPVDPGETPVDPGETPVDPGETPVDPGETPVDSGGTSNTSNPQTGDNVLLYIVIGLMSVIGITGSTIYIKKRNN